MFSVKENKNSVDIFIDGAKNGAKTVINLFPTLLCLFVAIGALRTSGVIDGIINLIKPIVSLFNFPIEVLPLAILRPISGSASMGVATDIMKNYGVDSNIGKIASTIMGSTETTLYTIAIYTSCVKIKKIRFVLVASLIADIVGMIASVIICQNLS